MSIFEEIEAAEDQVRLAREPDRIRLDKIIACSHRRQTGFYNIKCDHPERRADGLCVTMACPAIK